MPSSSLLSPPSLSPSLSFLWTFALLLLAKITNTNAVIESAPAFCLNHHLHGCNSLPLFAAFTSLPRKRLVHHHDYLLKRQKQRHQRPYQSLTNDENADNTENEETSSFSSLDMEELSLRISKIQQFGPGLDSSSQPPPEHVYIILFRPGTEQEGAHTIEYPLGSGDNLMLAFESLEDCQEFGMVLERTDEVQFFDPRPQQMIYEALTSYCDSINVQVQFVPTGTELVPPSITVDQLDHDPALDRKVDKLNDIFFDDYRNEEENVSGGLDGSGGGIDNDFDEEESWG